MAYGDPLVTTDGPSYGQPIVRNVGTGGGGVTNPMPDPMVFQSDVDVGGNLSVAGEVRIGSASLALSDSIAGNLEVIGSSGIQGGGGFTYFGLFNLNGNAYVQLDNDDNIYAGVNLVVDGGVQLGGTFQLGVSAVAAAALVSTHKLRLKDTTGAEYDIMAVAV